MVVLASNALAAAVAASIVVHLNVAFADAAAAAVVYCLAAFQLNANADVPSVFIQLMQRHFNLYFHQLDKMFGICCFDCDLFVKFIEWEFQSKDGVRSILT